MSDAALKDAVKEHYARAARRVAEGSACCVPAPSAPEAGGRTALSAKCCAPTAISDTECGTISRNLYAPSETEGIPEQAVLASLGCGNPFAIAELRPGETVLDLGAGGGLDVLLSARRVGPAGKAYGVDMTDEMLALARENQRRAGVENAEFVKGDIEHVPLPDGAVDVVISNCVINLAADKDLVLREAYRLLRPGGRFAVSDIVILRPLPDDVRRSLELWAGCVAGALGIEDYRARLARAGFEEIEIVPVRTYTADDAHASLVAPATGPDGDGAETARRLDGALASATIRARRPSVS